IFKLFKMIFVFFYFLYFLFFFFFFFQAEDGIRDATVTGVQTCALPIFPILMRSTSSTRTGSPNFHSARASPSREMPMASWMPLRSEERRVGKECRSRWSA